MTTVSPGAARSARCAAVSSTLAMTRAGTSSRAQVGGQALDVEALGRRDLLGRVERRQHHLVGDGQRGGELGLEDARRLVAERGSKAAISLPGPKRPRSAQQGLADGGRVVGEVVDDGDARRRRPAPPGGAGCPGSAGWRGRCWLDAERPGDIAAATTPMRFSWL